MVFDKRIKIGVVGVGYLGCIHIQKLLVFKEVKLSGILDTNNERAKEIGKKYELEVFTELIDLAKISDAICIVTPTETHFSIAEKVLKFGCHVFIEKPITYSVKEANSLIKLSSKFNKIIQVGHIERFNAAYLGLNDYQIEPLFIECHRMSSFKNRGSEISVILDLMIHDLDIVISLIDSKISKVDANGISVISQNIDIANVRIIFKNGAVANLTASRLSEKQIRKLRIFQKDCYFTLDLLNKKLELYKHKNSSEIKAKDNIYLEGLDSSSIIYKNIQICNEDALEMEFLDFIQSIQNNTNPKISGYEGLKALELALSIEKIINESQNK